VTGRGLIVAGGSARAPGVELLPALPSVTASPLAYPSDASIGAGATTLATDTQHVLLAAGTNAGKDAGARVIDLACTAGCMPAKWATLPVALENAQAFSWDAANGLVIGSEPSSGLTHVFRLTSTAATEIATKVPHTNARAGLSPVDTVLVVGGAKEIESFVP
jgi:hypothetical protein